MKKISSLIIMSAILSLSFSSLASAKTLALFHENRVKEEVQSPLDKKDVREDKKDVREDKKDVREDKILKERLVRFKERQRQAVERINQQIIDINAKITDRMSKALDRIEGVANRINLRITELETDPSLNLSGARSAIDSVFLEINTTRTAVANQAGKTYSLADVVPQEGAIHSGIVSVRESFRGDLKTLHDLVNSTRLTVVKATQELKTAITVIEE